MKIAILIDRLNVGGVEKIAIEQVKALNAAGKSSTLVVLRRKSVVEGAFQDLLKNVPVIYLDDRLPFFLKWSFNFPVFYFFSSFHITYPFYIPFVIKKGEFDYIICHGTYTAFTAIAIKKLKNIPFSTFIWDPIGYILQRVYKDELGIFFKPLSMIAKWLDTLIIKESDTILVGGAAHDDYFKALNPKADIHSIPPSVHPLINLTTEKKDYIILVTAWKKGKAPEYIFELLKELPHLKCKIIGRWLDDSYKQEFMNEIKQYNAENNIEVVGEVTEEQLTNYYQEALALLQINDDRGFGMPALEAAGHGTTFIIPKGQGVCELFENGAEGFFVTEKATPEITQTVRLLLENTTTAKQMGEKAWQKVVQYYSWQKHAIKLYELVQKHVI